MGFSCVSKLYTSEKGYVFYALSKAAGLEPLWHALKHLFLSSQLFLSVFFLKKNNTHPFELLEYLKYCPLFVILWPVLVKGPMQLLVFRYFYNCNFPQFLTYSFTVKNKSGSSGIICVTIGCMKFGILKYFFYKQYT